jgi:hypothetical protein
VPLFLLLTLGRRVLSSSLSEATALKVVDRAAFLAFWNASSCNWMVFVLEGGVPENSGNPWFGNVVLDSCPDLSAT